VNALAYLAVALGMAVALSTLLWLVQRRPTSFFSSIDEFRREMDALGDTVVPDRARREEPPRAARRSRARGNRLSPIVPAPRHGDLARKLRAAREQRER
jgi:hypothetical protein